MPPSRRTYPFAIGRSLRGAARSAMTAVGRKWGRDLMGARGLLGDGVQDAARPRAAPVVSSRKEQSCQLPISCGRSHARGTSACKTSSTTSSPCGAPSSRHGCVTRATGAVELTPTPITPGALEEHALLERRIAALRQTLALAKVIDPDADGTAEADPGRGRISIGSPVGEAILGRRHGNVVDVQAPGGTQRIEILEIAPSGSALAA